MISGFYQLYSASTASPSFHVIPVTPDVKHPAYEGVFWRKEGGDISFVKI